MENQAGSRVTYEIPDLLEVQKVSFLAYGNHIVGFDARKNGGKPCLTQLMRDKHYQTPIVVRLQLLHCIITITTNTGVDRPIGGGERRCHERQKRRNPLEAATVGVAMVFLRYIPNTVQGFGAAPPIFSSAELKNLFAVLFLLLSLIPSPFRPWQASSY